MTISGLYVVILPFIYVVAELDDAPGLIIIGMVPDFCFISNRSIRCSSPKAITRSN